MQQRLGQEPQKKNRESELKSEGTPREIAPRPASPPEAPENQRDRTVPSGSADSVSEPSAAGRRKPSPKLAEIPLAPAEGPPEKVWDDYFRQTTPDPLAVCDL